MMRKRAQRAATQDGGFTLVEVVVALSLLTIVAVAAGMFMIRAFQSSRTLQDQQAAVQVAREVFENVNSIAPTQNKDTGKSPLVAGRSKSDVIAQWATLATQGIDVSDTYTGSGATGFDAHSYQLASGPSSGESIARSGTKTISAIAYNYQVAIGTCTRPRSSSECGKTGTGDELFRVVVVVTWKTGPNQADRRYVTSSLFDPSLQPVFNASRKPYAYDDEVHAYAGEQLSVPVLANDKGSWPLTGATSVNAVPSHGTAIADASSNDILYTPAGNYTGDDTFTYRAVDTNNVATNYGTVLLKVHPGAVADTATLNSTWSNSTVSIPVTGNDKGSLGSATVAITAAPTGGATATVSGKNVTFVAPLVNAVSTYQFKYTVTALGLTSKDALVTVTVNPPPPPGANAASSTATVGQLKTLDLGGVSGPAGITYSSPEPGVGFSGSVMSYTPTASGNKTIQYQVRDGLGRTASSTVTLNVAQPLVVKNVAKTAKSGTIVSVSTADYLVSGSPSTVVVNSKPDKSTATVSGTTVRISRSSSGSGAFTVGVTDANGASEAFTITLTTN